MKKTVLTTTIAALLMPSAFAALTTTYNDTIVYINGAGNPNTGWVSAVNDGTPNLKLGIRADSFIDGSTPNNGSGTYTFPAGLADASHAIWNYQFTVNSDTSGGGTPLIAYEYYLTLSGPSSFGPFPLLALGDNTYGDNTSSQGFNVVVGPGALAVNHNVMANSENIRFAPLLDPNNGGIYQFELYATSAGAGPGGLKLDDVSMTVMVPVPEPSTYVAGLLLLLPFGLGALRMLRKNRAA